MATVARPLALPDAEVIYYPRFLPATRTEEWMTALLKEQETRLKQHQIKIFGKELLEPRLSGYYGDYPYRYSGVTQNPLPWNTALLEIKEALEPLAGIKFNAMFLNLYRDGNDSVSWHSDNQKELVYPTIASVSFGATRKFQFRRKDKTGDIISLDLRDGDVLMMAGKTQEFWNHRIPKTSPRIASSIEPRINLTYRAIGDRIPRA
jgi:alkylated DNA repair dioxygenase AlkB